MARLHDALKNTNYTGHDLEIFVIRILFCLYAEDTGIFNNYQFTDFIKRNSEDNPQNLGYQIQSLFRILNQKPEDRQTNLTEEQKKFPYVNGKLFEEQIIPPAFNNEIYNELVHACNFDWSTISPSIFGSLFQYVIEPENRRNLGAHYTSEANILKVINSLFMTDLWKEFNKIKNNNGKLKKFHEKIGNLKFFDPACGCGNFLIVSYRELRLLEYEILKILINADEQVHFSPGTLTKIKIDHFYGIEIEEFPARIAQVAMWFIEHQMNLKYETLDIHSDNLPLKSSLNIYNENALRTDWTKILHPSSNVYVLGNPPFVGARLQSSSQKADMKLIFKGFKRYNDLDYVTCWYKKALDYIQDTNIECAFVSTNSICQGQQVNILWKQLHDKYNFYINFAHQTFGWDNEAKNAAGVYVIIVGFSLKERKNKIIYHYKKYNSLIPDYTPVKHINSYLLNYKEIFVNSSRSPLCEVPKPAFGSMPNDNGNFLFSLSEKNRFLSEEPGAKKYFKEFLSAKKYLNNEKRYCLWLDNITPTELKNLPKTFQRVMNVKEKRLESTREATKELAKFPEKFGEIRQPNTNYILIPRVSSGNREYIPMSFFNKDKIVGDTCLFVASDDLSIFGILTSKMHMAWVNYVGGKLKGDYRYSNTLVYNTFPFPEKFSMKKKDVVRIKAQNVLDIRDNFPNESLSNLYDPNLMPPVLKKAHHELDKAVDKLYNPKPFKDDNDRMRLLFKKYENLVNN